MLSRAAVMASMLPITLATALGVQGASAASRPSIVQAPVRGSVDAIGGPDLSTPGLAVHYLPRATPLPPIDADSWLVADLTTGQVLAAKGAHVHTLPASTLKTLTAVTLIPQLNKKTVITATAAEAKAEGGNVGIEAGATYSIWDLWHGFLLSSSNDAGAALADANGGEARTVAQMRAVAKHLQANDTVVKNESGLDAAGQVSSAYDMALIARAAMAIPDFRTLTKTISYDFPGKAVAAGVARPTYKIYSQNRILLHGFPGTVGGKTGFTSLAHRTFWGAATRGGHTLIVVLMQVHDSTEVATRNLLTWGFANVDLVKPIGVLVDPLAPTVAPTPGPTPSANASPGAAADTPGAPRTVRVQWLPVTGVVIVAVLTTLWLRRRRKSVEALEQPDVAPDSAPTLVPVPLPPSPAERPEGYGNARLSVGKVEARPAARLTSSVIVPAPERRPASTNLTPDLAPVTDPAAPRVETAAPRVVESDSLTEQMVRPSRDAGGHVRIVTPPKS